MAKFADILKNAGIPDEDRTALEAIVVKYPNLDDLAVAKTEFDSLKSTFDRTKTALDGWEKFRGEAWDSEHGMTKAQYAAQQEADTLRARVATLEAGGAISGEGEVVDFNKLEEELKTRGYVKATDVDKVATTIDNKMNIQGSNYEFLYAKTAHLPYQYAKEFGGDVDPNLVEGVFKLMGSDPSKELMKDPQKAYEIYVGPKRAESERTKLAAERAAFEAQKTEFAAQKTAAPTPTDTGEHTSIPPFQMIHDNPGDNPIDKLKGDATFGNGQFARRIADAYKSDREGLMKTTVQ